MHYRKTLIAAIAATGLMSASASANVGTDMQDWYNSMGGFSNTTPPSSYKGQTTNSYSGGGFYARTPVKTYQLTNMTPPSLDIGCGGIDLTAGAFSFINTAALTALFQNIGTSLSYAFLLAIKSSMPEMASLFEYLQDVASKVNGMNVNACKLTEGISLKEGAGISENMSSVFSQAAGAITNQFPDSFDSWKQTRTDSVARANAQAAAVAADPSKKDFFEPGNVVWKALSRVGGIDDNDRQLIMSITGTIVITRSSGDREASWDYKPPTGVAINNFVGEDTAAASTDIDTYACDTTTDCMSPTVGTTAITPFVKKVSDAVDALRTNLDSRSAQNINSFKIVEASTLPVWKLLAVSSINNQGYLIDNYKRLIAVDIAHSYFSKLLKIANAAMANIKNGQSPADAKAAIQSLIDSLRAVASDADALRTAEYTKSTTAADLQRQIQLMHQTLIAGIPAQAFNSMSVFGSR